MKVQLSESEYLCGGRGRRTMYQGQAGGRYVWVGGGRGSRSRYVCESVRGRGMGTGMSVRV